MNGAGGTRGKPFVAGFGAHKIITWPGFSIPMAPARAAFAAVLTIA